MSDIKTIFKYGGWMDDFEVWDEEDLASRNFPHTYHVSVEGFIWYNTLQDGINYYESMRDSYLNFLIENYKELNLETKNDSTRKYKSYDIEICNDENGWTIYVYTSPFHDLENTYYFIDGVVKQLKKIALEIAKEEVQNE
jgi:hypothetical protein